MDMEFRSFPKLHIFHFKHIQIPVQNRPYHLQTFSGLRGRSDRRVVAVKRGSTLSRVLITGSLSPMAKPSARVNFRFKTRIWTHFDGGFALIIQWKSMKHCLYGARELSMHSREHFHRVCSAETSLSGWVVNPYLPVFQFAL